MLSGDYNVVFPLPGRTMCLCPPIYFCFFFQVTSHMIECPPHLIGLLIGRGGSTIKRIKVKTRVCNAGTRMRTCMLAYGRLFVLPALQHGTPPLGNFGGLEVHDANGGGKAMHSSGCYVRHS